MNPKYELRIPKDRVAILIGKNGKIKRRLERLAQCKIKVNSKEGDVIIEGEDPLKAYVLVSVVKAIGRGFNPQIAEKLFDEDCCFEIISIKDYSGKSKNKEQRLKGRVIGEKGKTRRLMEEITQTRICVYGKTIGIIGGVERVNVARKGVEDLLKGSRHGPVYKKCYERLKEVQ